MKHETKHDLDASLLDWFRWSKGYSEVASHGACAMFTNVRSSRQWDSAGDIVDGSLHNAEMKHFDFQIMEMEDMHRTALQLQAKNLHTGFSVWASARLPQDMEQRAIVLRDARNELMKRLGWM